MSQLILIMAGGAFGAAARFAVTHFSQGIFQSYWATLSINILGSTIAGYAVTALGANAPGKAFLVVGFLGAFTTFSTFSVDLLSMLQTSRYATAAVYGVGSLLLSLGGCAAGIQIAKTLLRANIGS